MEQTCKSFLEPLGMKNTKKWMTEDVCNALHKENENIDASLEKYPQLKAFYND